MVITKPTTPFVNTAIDAIQMRHYLQFSYGGRFVRDIETRSLALERKARGGDVHQEDTQWAVRHCAELLAECEVIVWEPELFDAASSGHKVFEGTLCPKGLILPDDHQAIKPQLWFLRGKVWTDVFDDDEYCIARLLFPAISSVTGGLFLCAVSLSARGGGPVIEIENVTLESPLNDASAIIIAALQFMRLPITAKERLEPPRQYRRQAARENLHLPSVYTIRLRRAENGGSTRQESEKPKEFHCQWLVGAHWRNQFYPSDGKHRPVYILPYVKGDPSKPFKSPGEKVYAVVR